MLESRLDSSVAENEPLARFIFNIKHEIFAATKTAKPHAVYPAKDSETSVSRIVGLNDTNTRLLGLECERLRTDNPTLKGHIVFSNSKVLETRMKTIAKEPPPRHANIVGWPEERSLIKPIAQTITQGAPFYAIDRE